MATAPSGFSDGQEVLTELLHPAVEDRRRSARTLPPLVRRVPDFFARSHVLSRKKIIQVERLSSHREIAG
jgi:hypothetical protein